MKGKFSQPRNSASYIREGQTPPRRPPQRRRRRLNPRFPIFCLAVLLLIILLSCAIGGNGRHSTDEETVPPTETAAPTEPIEPVVATATLSATGDVLMHMPVVNSCYDSATGQYDFTGIFQYLSEYAGEADYAVANLETTLAGTDNGYAYSGYPCFNCPDAIATALKDAGFDMLLTANNHCYDTRTVGLTRTLEVAEACGLDTLGTQSSADAQDYTLQEINGIPVGMFCYSYATADSYPDRPSMNGILTGTEAAGMVNYFDYDQLDVFYSQVSAAISAMDAQGVKAYVMFIHWGEEYQLSPNANQTAIAQKLCDLGIDVIVGGHPHVIQPVELLTGTTNPEHKTLCLYSMGNAISNQQRQNMNLNTGHTEDGLLFSFGFTQYADGEVLLSSVDILPTWVWLDQTASPKTYRILTLDPEVTDWSTAFGISDQVAQSARDSYTRTMDLVGTGLEQTRTWILEINSAKLEQLTTGGQTHEQTQNP